MYQLRELQRDDLKIINQWRNDRELIRFLGAPFCYINQDVDEKWYESYLVNRGNTIRCAIIEQGKNQILGLISLTSVDYINQSAELHIMIGGKENRGKGIGTFAVTEMLKHAFYNVNLRRIELGVLETNERARHLFEKCGFVYEGRKKKAIYKNGEFIDLLLYAIVREDFIKSECDEVYSRSCFDIPTWCIGRTSYHMEIEGIIQDCDEAFGSYSLVHRKEYFDILRKIHQKGHLIFAYEKDVIGYCAFYANDDIGRNAFITLLAVKNKFQNKHVGAELLNIALEMAKEYNMLSCTLEVRKANLSAIRFYERNGFRICEEMESSYYMKRDL